MEHTTELIPLLDWLRTQMEEYEQKMRVPAGNAVLISQGITDKCIVGIAERIDIAMDQLLNVMEGM